MTDLEEVNDPWAHPCLFHWFRESDRTAPQHTCYLEKNHEGEHKCDFCGDEHDQEKSS